MAYKYSKGTRGLGDITFEDDADTGIDFEADTVKLETGGAERLVVTNTSITMSGEIIVDEYIKHNGDTDTFIKFTDDIVILKAGNKSMFRGEPTAGKIYINNGGHDVDFMVRDTSSGALLYTDAGNARVGIGTDAPDYTLDVAGDIGIDSKLIHNGDSDTNLRFLDNRITLNAGGLSMIDIDKKSSSPHEITINNGGNNVDFVVKGNGSNEGNPLFKCDASTGRVGINGVGSPDCELHVDGDVKVVGDDPRIMIDGDANSHPGLELYEAGTRKWIVYNDYTNDNLTFKTHDNIRMSIEQDGNVGIGTTSPAASLHVDGSYAGKASVVSSWPHTASSTDYIILATGAASPRKVTLPAISGQQGRIIIVKDASGDASSNNLEVDGNGSETIDGSADKLISSNYGFLVLVCGASEWHVIGQ